MDIEFGNKNLLNLYTTGTCRRPKLTEEIKKKFFMRIRQFEASLSVSDLWKTSSLNFEHLKGFENRYSVRLNNKWRLEFDVEWEVKDKIFKKVTLLEISKHYGD